MADYRCLVCEEIFENKIIAVIHHVTTKHEDYEVVGTDLKMKVKS